MGAAQDAIQAADGSGLSRLLRRKAPSVVHFLRAAEPEVEQAARAAVIAAREAVGEAEYSLADDQPELLAAAKEALAAANAVLAGCYEPVTIQALAPQQYEALLAAHPARDGEEEAYNTDTFPRELFYECVQGDLTREQWENDVIPQLSQGELLGLLGDAVAVNSRFTGGDVPKG